MKVNDTYCLGEWEKHYTEKPLSFIEFVETSTLYDTIFPHILEKIREISSHPEKTEYYIQGCLGSGKSVISHYLFLYKIYLFLILKNPQDFYKVHSTQSFIAVAFCKDHKKRATLFLRSIDNIATSIPFFNKDVIYKTDVNGSHHYDLVCFKYLDNSLTLKSFSSKADLIGENIVIGIMDEASFFDTGAPTPISEETFDAFLCLKDRVSNRCGGTIIIEKHPTNVLCDSMEDYIYGDAVIDSRAMVILLRNWWELQRWRNAYYTLDSCFDLDTLHVVPEPGKNTINFPSVVYYKDSEQVNLLDIAIHSPAMFVQEYVGEPLYLLKKGEMAYMLGHIKTLIIENNISILYQNGKVYLVGEFDKFNNIKIQL